MAGYDDASAGRTDANGGIDTFGLLHIPTEIATTVVQPAAATTFVDSGTLANDGDTVAVDTTGMASVAFTFSGSFDGSSSTVFFERSFDGGSTWVSIEAFQWGSLFEAQWSPQSSSGDVSNVGVCPTSGANRVRVRLATSLASGVVGVYVSATSADAGVMAVIPIGTVTVAPFGGVFPVSLDGSNVTVPVEVTASTSSVTTASAAIAAVDDQAAFTQLVEDVVIQTVDNSFVGTLVCEVSVDGTNWVQVSNSLLYDVAAGATAALDASGVWSLRLGSAINNVRVRCSAYTSGDVAVSLVAARR